MKSLALTWIAAGLLVGSANAAMLRLDATSLDPGINDFDVLFDDTGDGLLQYEEIISSSGLLFADGGSFPRLFGVPDLEDVSTIGGPCVDPGSWCFLNAEGDLSVSITTDTFTYLISPVSVDEPSMMSLLAVGAWLLLLRTRRRKARRRASSTRPGAAPLSHLSMMITGSRCRLPTNTVYFPR